MLLLSVCPSLSLSDNFLHSLIYVYIYIYIYTVELNWWTKHVTSNPEILCSFLSSDHLLLGAVFGVLAVPGYTMGQCRGAECKTLGREGGRRGGAWRRATAGRGDWFGATDSDGSSWALYHSLLCPLLDLFLLHLLLLSLQQVLAPPVPLSSLAFPGWEEAWSQVSPSSVWSLSLLLWVKDEEGK